jgi:hypothetical protein
MGVLVQAGQRMALPFAHCRVAAPIVSARPSHGVGPRDATPECISMTGSGWVNNVCPCPADSAMAATTRRQAPSLDNDLRQHFVGGYVFFNSKILDSRQVHGCGSNSNTGPFSKRFGALCCGAQAVNAISLKKKFFNLHRTDGKTLQRGQRRVSRAKPLQHEADPML